MDRAAFLSKDFSDRFLRVTSKGYSAYVRMEFLAELNDKMLIDLISSETRFRADGDSPGRGAVRRVTFPSGRQVIFRRFFRGGFIRRFNRELFLRLRATPEYLRPEWELRILDFLWSAGRRVPKPVASMVSLSLKGMAYRGAIATEELSDVKNLLSLVREKDSAPRLLDLARKAGVEAGKILRAGVLHRDLHLGNVLVDSTDEIVLLDFDSARLVDGAEAEVRGVKFLKSRWQRSITRHQLGVEFTTAFEAGLAEGLS